MALVKLLSKAICVWVACLSLTQADTRAGVAEEIIERLLGISNSEKLNTVLGRIEKNRQGLSQKAKPKLNDDCDDTESVSEQAEPVENSRDRSVRHIVSQQHDRICQINRTIHRLSTDEYEYKPAYYEEIRCNITHNDEVGHKNEICSSIGLSCVQWNKTIHLTRRRFTSDCWETKTLIVPAGCECMWPVHKFGAISSYLYVRP